MIQKNVRKNLKICQDSLWLIVPKKPNDRQSGLGYVLNGVESFHKWTFYRQGIS